MQCPVTFQSKQCKFLFNRIEHVGGITPTSTCLLSAFFDWAGIGMDWILMQPDDSDSSQTTPASFDPKASATSTSP